MEAKLNGFGREYVRDPIIPLKYIYTLSCRVFHKIFKLYYRVYHNISILYTTGYIIIYLYTIIQGTS